VLGADQINLDLTVDLPALSAEGQRLLHGPSTVGGTEEIGTVVFKQGQGEGLDALAAAREGASRALAEAGPGATVVFSWKVIKRG